MKSKRGLARGDQHIRLHHWMLRSLAWRALSPVEKAVLLDLWQRHNGINNGQIVYGVREAEKIGVSKSVAAVAVKRLVELGFLKVTRDANFKRKTQEARCWALTAEPIDDRVPTKDFMRWQPGKVRPKQPKRDRPNRADSDPENLFLSPSPRTVRSVRTDRENGHPENTAQVKDLLGGAGGGQNGIGGDPQETAKALPETAKNDDFTVRGNGPIEGSLDPSPRTLIVVHGRSDAKPEPAEPPEPAGAVRPTWRVLRGDQAKAARIIRRPS
jgi:hypothetical protein